ncbi:PREDICTED: intraflagellar transport protein 81 homolog, partial [Nicrophorus vespilloides]|uniref:Intraflagellar transport protein 81 homolog n=1 Tax=Nicrophorus vespilloides TaxID=110193 RepID=A0ABM1M0R9_NICVS
MEKLQFITRELNRLFGLDHNCSSFNSLGSSQLLQIVVDVMVHLQLTTDTHSENPAYVILSILNSIKYTPDGNTINPEDFRNGLIEGQKNVVHPILHFMLTNQKAVKKRHYLSQFVKKIEVPEECRDDSHGRYEQAIELFWETYKENQKYQQLASETSELQEDMCKMRSDLKNLNARIQQQKSKLSQENIDGKRFESIKTFSRELKHSNKLQKQLTEESLKLSNLEQIYSALNCRKRITSLEDLLEQSERHQETVDNLKKALILMESEKEIYSKVENEINPNNYELDYLENQIEEIQTTINLSANNRDSTCEVFINQLKTFAKKKQQISKQIAKGKNLKDYVTKLRETSVDYKKLKIQWNGLQAELGVLQRTMDILKLDNPELSDFREVASPKSRDEIKAKSRGYEKLRNDALIVEIEYRRVKESYDCVKADWEEAKATFDAAVGGLGEDIEILSTNYSNVQDMIEMEMETLNRCVEEAEKFKECLLKFSQAEIEAGDETYLEVVKDKLKVLEMTRFDLVKKMDAKNEKNRSLQQEILQIRGCIEMIN